MGETTFENNPGQTIFINGAGGVGVKVIVGVRDGMRVRVGSLVAVGVRVDVGLGPKVGVRLGLDVRDIVAVTE